MVQKDAAVMIDLKYPCFKNTALVLNVRKSLMYGCKYEQFIYYARPICRYPSYELLVGILLGRIDCCNVVVLVLVQYVLKSKQQNKRKN